MYGNPACPNCVGTWRCNGPHILQKNIEENVMCNKNDEMRNISTVRKLFNLEFAVAKIRELHKPFTVDPWDDEDGDTPMVICNHCDFQVYPCPTIKALDGEQE